MRTALLDPRRRENALKLADESWSVPVVRALAASIRQTPEPAVRGRIVANLAGQYRKYPAWSGSLVGLLIHWPVSGLARPKTGMPRG